MDAYTEYENSQPKQIYPGDQPDDMMKNTVTWGVTPCSLVDGDSTTPKY
jgi:hypothetical protein